MSQNAASFAGPNREQIVKAAVLSVMDELKDEQIAAAIGVSRRTLVRWRHRDDYLTARAAAWAMWRYLNDRRPLGWRAFSRIVRPGGL
jgi:hypothetical protein